MKGLKSKRSNIYPSPAVIVIKWSSIDAFGIDCFLHPLNRIGVRPAVVVIKPSIQKQRLTV
jgi:hypothetical protein